MKRFRGGLAGMLGCLVFGVVGAAGAGEPGQPSTWVEPQTGLRFVEMPGGCFRMGDTLGRGESNELPVHEVCLKSYWIGETEVTQAGWMRLMPFNPSVFNASPTLPVDSINQSDVASFAARLNAAHPDRHFRLPTEAEWEYACRAGGQDVPFGSTEPPPGGANTAEYADRYGEGSTPVGRFAPNALGLSDMSGNLWEWVSDVYAADAYVSHPRDNPEYQAAGPSRLLRGGGWSHDAAFARCTKRHMHCRPTARFDFVGFRLVMELKLQQK